MNDSFLTNWVTQLRKGILEFCVLNVLEDASLYGYDIVRRLRALEVLVIGEGTIYPILARLEEDGLVTSEVKPSNTGPPRTPYRRCTSAT